MMDPKTGIKNLGKPSQSIIIFQGSPKCDIQKPENCFSGADGTHWIQTNFKVDKKAAIQV
jgi:hypothetical protein